MNIGQILKCAYYNCQNKSVEGYKCCSAEHGYLHKGMISQLKKYQDGLINWKYLWNPFEEECPDIGKMEFYAKLIE